MFRDFYRNVKLLWSCRQENSRDFGRIFKLMRVYEKLDGAITRFRWKTGIHCAKGCGQCCENPYVEATVLEMLPLAAALIRRNEAQRWLQGDQPEYEKGRCPFYQPDGQVAWKGRCSVYPLRPLICRMFGYSGKKDKEDKKQYYTCERIETQFRDICQRINHQKTDTALPMMEDYSMQRLELAREIDRNLYPLPLALKKALERIGFQRQLCRK